MGGVVIPMGCHSGRLDRSSEASSRSLSVLTRVRGAAVCSSEYFIMVEEYNGFKENKDERGVGVGGSLQRTREKDRKESGKQTRGKEANEAAWMCQARGVRDWKVCEFCCVCTPWY